MYGACYNLWQGSSSMNRAAAPGHTDLTDQKLRPWPLAEVSHKGCLLSQLARAAICLLRDWQRNTQQWNIPNRLLWKLSQAHTSCCSFLSLHTPSHFPDMTLAQHVAASMLMGTCTQMTKPWGCLKSCAKSAQTALNRNQNSFPTGGKVKRQEMKRPTNKQ